MTDRYLTTQTIQQMLSQYPAMKPEKPKPTTREVVWGLLLMLVGAPLSLYLDILTIYLLWGWFVVPLGVVAISFMHACGLVVLMNFLKYSVADYMKSEKAAGDSVDSPTQYLQKVLGYRILASCSCMAFGYAFFYFMS
jgi:hypothetical protein|tara:strand:+ start:292484 stop:292897 length:414 start_codon:yes stop_codon:yes gene_type:complete